MLYSQEPFKSNRIGVETKFQAAVIHFLEIQIEPYRG